MPKTTCPHLEAEDDGPDEAKDKAVVAIHNIMGAHVLQVHPLLLQELQSLVHILQAVDPHPALGGLGLGHKNAQHPPFHTTYPAQGHPHAYAATPTLGQRQERWCGMAWQATGPSISIWVGFLPEALLTALPAA